MRLTTIVLAAGLAALAVPAFAAEEPTECDVLAANPGDPARLSPGVAFDGLDGKAAEAACREALAKTPGVPRLQFQLGRALDRLGRFEEARAAYQAASDTGYGIAAQAQGKLFELGLGSGVDYAQAAALYERAIEAGHASAAGDLAYLHEHGLGFPKDAAKAADLYRVAAEAGDAWSQVQLGFLYEKGNGVEQNDTEAVGWYRKAADQGFALGQFDLGMMYAGGRGGLNQDTPEAIRLFRLAADQNNGFALLQLARYSRDGTGMTKDEAQAERLFREAIESGTTDAVWSAENELAWMWAVAGKNLDEAANLAAAAVAKVPKEHLDRAAVYDTAAWVEHLRGKDTEALANQAEAVKLSPDYAPFHDRLGDIYAALGRQDEATAEWRKALALPDPGSGDDGWDRIAINRKLRAPE
jgi:TPR repeat protein